MNRKHTLLLIPILSLVFAWSAQAFTLFPEDREDITYLGKIDITGEFTEFRKWSTPGPLPFGIFGDILKIERATGLFAYVDRSTFTMDSPYLWDDENRSAPMVWNIDGKGQTPDFTFETLFSSISLGSFGWGVVSINGFNPNFAVGNYLGFAMWEFEGPAIGNPFDGGPDVTGPMSLRIRAGYYDRTPSVPDTGSTLVLLGMALTVLGGTARALRITCTDWK